MSHPYATHTDPGYENFQATCPVCDTSNIFNRATDLEDLGLISFRTVECLNSLCRRQFNINCDLASPDYQMFIMQCYNLKDSKQYMFSIVVLAQAFELFFSSYLYKVLVHDPVKDIHDSQKAIDLGDLERKLYGEIEKFTYQKLRNVFLNTVTEGLFPLTPSEASAFIQSIPSKCSDPSDAKIDTCQNTDIKRLLHDLKNSRISSLRNRVVHKQGYRPRLDEVENALSEARRIIFGLDSYLGARWQA